MKSLYNENEAKKYTNDLDLRVYTSRLLGKESALVLHGGGNTSVKSTSTNLFGETEDILYVKGSGWDLATIEAQGFAPVKMAMLLKMAKLEKLDDTNMVKYQRMAMTDPNAPNPSVEAILHAIIPFKFVDHTHTDDVIAITNTNNGEEKIKEIYGDKVLVIPYIMPGFVLAKLVYDMTRDINWDELEGMVLLNHGLFTFDDNAKKSYEKTIDLVSKAEKYLEKSNATLNIPKEETNISTLQLAKIRKQVSLLKNHAIISTLNESDEAIYFSKQDIKNISQQGPLTPDHVIRTKRTPAILSDDFENDLDDYITNYKKYFNKNKKDETLLNPAPNFAILPNNGSLSFGKNPKEANIIKDINNHTYQAILKAEKIGGFKALSPKHIFDVEYWELEQAKLKKSGNALEFAGKIAIIVDGASEVSLKVANELSSKGATIVAIDSNEKVESIFNSQDKIGIKCDLTIESEVENAIKQAIKSFGGIDMLISQDILEGSHKKLIEQILPYLKVGINPTMTMVSTKNFLDLSKKEQFDKMSLDLGEYGIKVNVMSVSIN